MKEQLLLWLKKLLSNGLLILLIIAVLYILFLRECKKPLPCPAEDEIIVKKDVWKDMIALADKPPVVRVDTFWKERPTITPNPQPPLPNPQHTDIGNIVNDSNEGINFYQDSLIKKDINVWVDYSIEGILLSRNWRYKPISSTVTRDSIYTVIKYKEIEKPVKQPQNGLYAYGTAGGNKTAFLFGGGLDWITKKDTELGYMYQRFGDINFHSVKLGIKIKFGR